MTERRVYSKPEIASVNLIPDEVVLAECKNGTVTGALDELVLCSVQPACSQNAS